jgi:hypothetical protein
MVNGTETKPIKDIMNFDSRLEKLDNAISL